MLLLNGVNFKELFELKVVEKDVVKNHERSEYNRYEWIRKMISYEKYLPTYYINEVGDIYISYNADGINFFKEFGYISSISSANFRLMTIGENSKIRLYDLRYPNSIPSRILMKSLSETNPEVLFSNEF